MARIGGIRINGGGEFTHAGLEPAVSGAWRLQDRIHDGAHAASEHLLEFGAFEDQVVKAIGPTMAVERVLGGEGVVEVTTRAVVAVPLVALRQVNVPHNGQPLASGIRVAVEIIIFMSVIGIGVELPEDQIVNGGGDVDIIVAVRPPSGARLGWIERVGEGVKVGIGLSFPGLFSGETFIVSA